MFALRAVTGLVCLLALFVSTNLFADDSTKPQVIEIWKETPPGPAAKVDGPEIDRQKPNDRLVGGKSVMKIGNVANAEVHVYAPPKDKANGAACVICPGGGYHILAWDLEGVEVAEWLNSLGVTAFVLKYRVPTGSLGSPQKWEGPVMDAQRTLSLVRSRANEWNVDPDRVGVLGFSAGGNLAAMTAIKNGNRLYKANDDIDQKSCAADFAILVYPAYLVDEQGTLLPDVVVSKDLPPMFFVHAADDRVTCLSSVALFAGLKQAGVPAELHIFSSGGHGYGLRPTEQAVTHWPRRAGEWLGEMKLLTR